MSHSIFIANPTALIAQPGRAVNTFPSGLVRVDQPYLGLTSQAATHRATLAVGNNMPDGNSSPCIDGLKIFPEVQERRREDGFTEFIVSAYGRVNTTGQKTIGEELMTTLVRFGIGDLNGAPHPPWQYIECYADTINWLFCAPKNSPVSLVINDIAKVFEYDGTQLQTLTFQQFLSRFFPAYLNDPGYFLKSNPKAVSYNFNSVAANIVGMKVDAYGSLDLNAVEFQVQTISKTNFGSFDEWTVTFKPYLPVFNFQALGTYYLNSDPFGSADLSEIIDPTITNVSLGEVWALNTTTLGLGSTPATNYSELIFDTWVTTPTGRAKLGTTGITTEFGYYTPNSLGNGTIFTPFSRPDGGTWNGLGQGPQTTITEGVATWDLDMGPDVGGNGGQMFFYVYNLKAPIHHSRALYMAFRWEQNVIEDGVTTTFEKTAQAVYEPEVLVPQGQ